VTLAPVGTLPLSEQVYRQLLAAILRGDLAGSLPSERELSATFGVNRHAVREAIKRLQQANLVEVNQGGATRVLALVEHGRLDLMPDLLVRDEQIDHDVVTSVLEMRACIGADAARLCALRSPHAGALLGPHIQACVRAVGAELEAANLAYWTAIVDGAHNLAYRLALNTLVAGLDATALAPGGPELMAALYREYRDTAAMTALAEAISAGDAATAEHAAAALLTPVTTSMR
jgi:DNA-binding FadR family transcriptional regulator